MASCGFTAQSEQLQFAQVSSTEPILDGTNHLYGDLCHLCEKLNDITRSFCDQHEVVLSALKRVAADSHKQRCSSQSFAGQDKLPKSKRSNDETGEENEMASRRSMLLDRTQEFEGMTTSTMVQPEVSEETKQLSTGQAIRFELDEGAIPPVAPQNLQEKTTVTDSGHVHEEAEKSKVETVDDCLKEKGTVGGTLSHFSHFESENVIKTRPANSTPVDDSPMDKFPSTIPKTWVPSGCPDVAFVLRPAWQSKIDLARVNGRVVTRNFVSTGLRATPMNSGVSLDRIHSHFIVPFRPDSTIRMTWDLLLICCLLWDILVTPLDICFNLPDTTLLLSVTAAIRIAWTIDLVLCFCTGTYDDYGKLIMTARIVIKNYVTTWFIVDIMVISVDWLFFFLFVAGAEGGSSNGFAPATIMRLSRLVKILRTLARMWRLARSHLIPKMLFEVMLLDSRTMSAFGGVVKSFGIVFIFFHYVACLWFAISSPRDSLPEDTQIPEKYMVSMQWALQNLYGLNERSVNSVEGCYSIAVVFWSFILINVLVAKVTLSVSLLESSNLVHEQTACNRFLKRRHISVDNSVRMKLVIRSRHCSGARAILEEETRLLQLLPKALQYDLHSEVRGPFLMKHKFLAFLDKINMRLTRQIAHEAIEEVEVTDTERVFHVGDACRRALLHRRGCFEYEFDPPTLRRSSVSLQADRGGETRIEHVSKGQMISEIVLWTEWEHPGTLTATTDSILFAIDYEIFGDVVRQHLHAIIHAVKYGKRFICLVNSSEDNRTDLFDYTYTGPELEPQQTSPFQHFIFLSHYKQEAGTEATLLYEELTQLVQADPLHPANELVTPIFVDSEGLDDLQNLTMHVAQSDCLVLLLTSNVLSRPWCLIEIVTAYRAEVQIVPVEVQSRRFAYEYPDDSFYTKFLMGATLSASDISLLRCTGISLEDCATAIRETFTKIACPFSPHKSRLVRQAEMLGILERIRVAPATSISMGMNHRRTITFRGWRTDLETERQTSMDAGNVALGPASEESASVATATL
eukprot:TRINITY_DN54737_c0_g1_i1.p1 TRINITY_DN54737_c0_g1~~TRINITY_DN54737_c0_g1_i1.p1  ORF type:complete len:1044 (-),score=135.19 TRINITY_DN54737_c0_g1_i1:39-3119(-)